MSRRLVLGLTWLAATVIAVFVALQAVGAIGDQVTNTPTAASRPGGSTTTTSTTPTSASTTTTAPIPSAPAPASAASTAVPASAAAPSPDPAFSSTPAPAPEQEQHQGPVEDQPAPAPSPSPTTSYNLDGGSIGVRCTGSTIELVYSSPAQGFGSDVNSSGPSEVDVRFESDSHRSRIKVQCSGGAPVVTDQREEPR